jgi:outer membrane protein
MLPGKRLVGLHPFQRVNPHFLFHLGFRHLMDSLDRHLGIFRPKFNQCDAAAGPKRGAKSANHFVRVIEFVINVHQQCQINRRRRELWVSDRAQDGLYVIDLERDHFVREQVEHLLLNLDGIDNPLLPNRSRQASGIVTGPRSDIRDRIPSFEFESGNCQVRPFLLLPFRPLQPFRTLVSHYLRDLPAHVKLADAVRIMIGPSFVFGLRNAVIGILSGARYGGNDQQERNKRKSRATAGLHERDYTASISTGQMMKRQPNESNDRYLPSLLCRLTSHRALKMGSWRIAALVTMLLASPGPTLCAPSTQKETPWKTNLEPISRADAINIALQQNPSIRKAQKDLEATEGVVIQTRAIAIPKVRVNASYSAVQESDIDRLSGTNFPSAAGIPFGNDQNWSTQVRLVQSLYEGGRILSALRTAKLARQQSILNYQTLVTDALVATEIAYFDVLLTQQQIGVQEASVELLKRELTETTRRFNAGTVPRFNVLRAEVELANRQPKLIQARNAYRIAKNNLATILGFNIPRDALEDIPLTLSDKLEAEPLDVELPNAIKTALERRTELSSLQKGVDLREEDVVSAKAGQLPSLEAYGGYDAHNSLFTTDLDPRVHGWITGVQLNWNIFDGLETRGRVMQARALHEKAAIELQDTGRRIELEVRTAYSNFREAAEVLKSQEKVVEQGEEALRLAAARAAAGSATQLDVLSAQTALTDARTTQVQALHDYAVARAKLQRAMGVGAR